MNIISIFLSLIQISIVLTEIICNNQTLDEIDSAMAIVMNNGPNRAYPENRQEVQPFCEETKRAAKVIETINKSKCMKNLAKQLTSIYLYTIKTMINRLCKSNSKRLDRFLSGAHCANTVKRSSDGCHNKFIDSLLGIYHADDKLKIPHVCCEYYKIHECMRSSAQKHSVCTEDRIESTIEFTRDLTQNTANFLCGDYSEESDKCSQLPKRPMKRKSQIRPKSFILPIINIFESFANI